MGAPLISVTTATYNCEGTVARTVESVLGQDYPSIEYVVMDGASTDGTLDVVNSYAADFDRQGYVLKVVSRPDDGMYDAINHAMDMCSGELLGNVNGDDHYEPGAFRLVAQEYLEHPFDVLYADLRIHTRTGSFVKKALPMGSYPTSRKWNHPTMFLARAARGLRYRDDGNPYADFDLYLQATRAGMEVRPFPHVVSNFEFGGMSTKKSLSDVRKRIRWRNEIYRDNGCPAMTYAEGVAMELGKFIRA